jgi:hypothetical protein
VPRKLKSEGRVIIAISRFLICMGVALEVSLEEALDQEEDKVRHRKIGENIGAVSDFFPNLIEKHIRRLNYRRST